MALISSFFWEFPYTAHSSVDTCLSTLVRDDSHKLVIPPTHVPSLPMSGQHWPTTDGPAPNLLGELMKYVGEISRGGLPGGHGGEVSIWDETQPVAIHCKVQALRVFSGFSSTSCFSQAMFGSPNLDKMFCFTERKAKLLTV